MINGKFLCSILLRKLRWLCVCVPHSVGELGIDLEVDQKFKDKIHLASVAILCCEFHFLYAVIDVDGLQ